MTSVLRRLRSRSCALAFLFTFLLSNCARGAAHSTEAHITFAGLDRSYRIYRPAALSRGQPAPLVVMLHGRHDSSRYAEKAYHWDHAADAHGFVVVYPDGYRGMWNAGHCCGVAVKRQVDDVGFLTALVNKLTAQENIDPKRTYIAGMSNGALMAYRMACDSPLHLAAIGTVAGDLVKVCAETHPTSILEIHGGLDKLLPLNGKDAPADSDYIPSVQTTLDHWITADNCGLPHTTLHGEITETVRDCDAGRAVELIAIANAGHQWPGSIRHLRVEDVGGSSEPSTLLDATAKLWEFFAAHPLR